MSTDYFFQATNRQFMPSTYMLYMYTNVVEMGTVIAHLCNMLTEIEDKYRFIPVPGSVFGDYHLNVLEERKFLKGIIICLCMVLRSSWPHNNRRWCGCVW